MSSDDYCVSLSLTNVDRVFLTRNLCLLPERPHVNSVFSYIREQQGCYALANYIKAVIGYRF